MYALYVDRNPRIKWFPRFSPIVPILDFTGFLSNKKWGKPAELQRTQEDML